MKYFFKDFTEREIRIFIHSFNRFGDLSRIDDIIKDAKFDEKPKEVIKILLK